MIYKALERLIRKTLQKFLRRGFIWIHGRLVEKSENRNRTTSESFCKISFQWGLLPGQWCFWSHQPAWQAAHLARLPSKPKEAPMADVPTWQAHARQALGSSPGITSLRKWQLVASRHSWQNSRQNSRQITHLYAVRLTTQSLHVTTLGISRSRTQSRHLPLKLFDLSLDLSTRKTHRPMTSSPVRRSRWHVENLTPAAESAWACPCKKRCTELLNVSEPITKSKNVKAARKLVITLQ